MMTRLVPSLFIVFCLTLVGVAADLVNNGQPVAEIVVADNPTPSVKTAATELQRHLEAMSGAKLAIVSRPSPGIGNQVYVGESEYTRKLGVTMDDIQYDGFKIIARGNYVVLAGRQMYHYAAHCARFKDVARNDRQKAWEEFCGHKWRSPSFWDERNYQKDLGFYILDGTGTLYAMYELLEQLGLRWYMPDAELGIVIPKLKDIRIKDQDLKKEPQFPQRIMSNVGSRYKDEFLWYKSMKMGVAFGIPHHHSVGRLLEFYKEEQPREYYGEINGKVDTMSPRLTSERLREDFLEYLEWFDKAYPGFQYAAICQPDGWSTMDSRDTAVGWDRSTQRGTRGCFSDYAWDFNLDIRKRYMQRFPDKKFVVYAYAGTNRPPTIIDKVPDNMVVAFCQTSPQWMSAPYNQDREVRDEWLKMLDGKNQLLIYDYYLEQAPIRNFPPVPVIFTKFMQQNFREMYGRCLGFQVEVPWITSAEAKQTPIHLRRPGLSHLMLYLHNRFCWDKNLDVPEVLNEYYDLFFGPARAEMKEFYEFAEEVWIRPEQRQITVAGGFLKPADVNRYFDILTRAGVKAGDSIYGKRIGVIALEMEPLKQLFEKLNRTGPTVHAFIANERPKIDGDLDKPFWRARPYTFNPLRDLTTGEIPRHVGTSVSLRWLADDSALIVGIECLEPRMSRLKEACKDRDSMSIFADDNVEIRLETAQGIRPFIVINPAGTVYDECVTANVADLPHFYTVKPVAVKKYPDRWTVEVQVDAKPIAGERPTDYFPWGVQVNRQRMAGNRPEHYMLSPSGTSFKDLKCMGNLMIRK